MKFAALALLVSSASATAVAAGVACTAASTCTPTSSKTACCAYLIKAKVVKKDSLQYCVPDKLVIATFISTASSPANKAGGGATYTMLVDETLACDKPTATGAINTTLGAAALLAAYYMA